MKCSATVLPHLSSAGESRSAGDSDWASARKYAASPQNAREESPTASRIFDKKPRHERLPSVLFPWQSRDTRPQGLQLEVAGPSHFSMPLSSKNVKAFSPLLRFDLTDFVCHC